MKNPKVYQQMSGPTRNLRYNQLSCVTILLLLVVFIPPGISRDQKSVSRRIVSHRRLDENMESSKKTGESESKKIVDKKSKKKSKRKSKVDEETVERQARSDHGEEQEKPSAASGDGDNNKSEVVEKMDSKKSAPSNDKEEDGDEKSVEKKDSDDNVEGNENKSSENATTDDAGDGTKGDTEKKSKIEGEEGKDETEERNENEDTPTDGENNVDKEKNEAEEKRGEEETTDGEKKEDKGESEDNNTEKEEKTDEEESPTTALKNKEESSKDFDGNEGDEERVPMREAVVEEETEESFAMPNLEDFDLNTLSLSSCEKIDFAVSYLTSLEFDGSYVSKSKENQPSSAYWSDVQYIQMVVIPISLCMAFFGSSLVLPVCIMTALFLGIFLVFHFVNGLIKGGLPCKVKLGLSSVSALGTVTLAVKYVRFGLFTLGSVGTGVVSYMLFDTFPAFDPGVHSFKALKESNDLPKVVTSMVQSSDISHIAWGITLIVALFTGICIRVHQQACLEVLTATMGGIGLAYSIHSYTILHGGTLNRSIVFVLAFFIGFIGWRFQRRCRLRKSVRKEGRKSLPRWNTNAQSDTESWAQLQASIDSTNNLLSQSSDDDDVAVELAGLLTSFQEKVKERGKAD